MTSAAQLDATPSIDPALYREVLGHYPTGVTVVTAFDGDEPIGMVVGTFTSVSLDPPLVAFMPTTGSGTYARLARASAYCINVLAHDQQDLCRTMATPGDDKFARVAWHRSDLGAPALDDAVALVHCIPEQEIEAGDHYIVLCRVQDLEVSRPVTPLLFFQGGYGGFSPAGMAARGDADLIDSASPDIRSRVVPHDIEVPAGATTPSIPPPRVAPFVVHEDELVRVSATLVDHGQMYPAFAFRFDTENGSVVFSGDTTVSENLIELARGCDYLVHEVIDRAWVEQSVAGLPAPPEVKDAFLNHLLGAHTTIEQVGSVAQAAGAKNLVLNHFVPGELPKGRWNRAGKNFNGKVIVGEDLMQIAVGRARR